MTGNQASIHFRRRWFYVLWCGLLALSLGAWTLWETPGLTGSAHVNLRLRIQNVPVGCQAQAWAGPRGNWPPASWQSPAVSVNQGGLGDQVTIPGLPFPVAFRRWVRDYIPRRTADLLVVRIQPPEGEPRYFALFLGADWRTGLLTPGRVMTLTANCSWRNLTTDPGLIAQLH
jgi:hypothetical protein